MIYGLQWLWNDGMEVNSMTHLTSVIDIIKCITFTPHAAHKNDFPSINTLEMYTIIIITHTSINPVFNWLDKATILMHWITNFQGELDVFGHNLIELLWLLIVYLL